SRPRRARRHHRSMPEERKLATNLHRPKKGGGPNTRGGKARARRNAMRHGLAAATLLEPTHSAQVECVARAICGENADAAQYQQAQIIAESGIKLSRIRAARVALLENPPAPAPHASATAIGSVPLPVMPTPLEEERALEAFRCGDLREAISLLERG